MPAHVTVLYPFVRLDRLDEAGLHYLRNLFGRIAAPELEFRGFGTFEEVLWLALTDASAVITLTELVVERWPETPPYGGLYPSIVPHLTIAAGPGAEHLSHVRHDVARHLPIRSRPGYVHLLELRDRWQTVERFSFRK